MNSDELIKKTLKEKLTYIKEYPEKMKIALDEIGEDYPKEVEKYINIAILGKHLTKEMLEDAIEGMEFAGDLSPWTITQTNDIAKQINVDFNKFNQYDFNFMMNWFLSDMSEIWGTDAVKYGKYAKFMLEKDPDNAHPEERAYHEAKKFIKRYENEK